MSLIPIQSHLIPSGLKSTNLHGSACVILDILRFSSSVVTAFRNGCQCIMPVTSVTEAKAKLEGGLLEDPLLCGERGGVLIDGFDLGNSPSEYSPDAIAGRNLIFTTTNGTKALDACLSADKILIGSLLNREAIVNRLVELEKPVHLVCAGTDGEISQEDLIGAGAIIESLLKSDQFSGVDDSTQICHRLFLSAFVQEQGIHDALKQSRGGRNINRLGFDDDIAYCAQLDQFPLIPHYDFESQVLVA